MPTNIKDYNTLDVDVAIRIEDPTTLDPDSPRAWERSAVCATVYGDSSHSWCPERAQSRPFEKRICWEECPVRRDCLTWAISQMEKHCIYGGYNHGERRAIWRQWKDRGILPDYIERAYVDPEEAFRVMSETGAGDYGDTENVLDFRDGIAIYEYDEPDETILAAIEEESL